MAIIIKDEIIIRDYTCKKPDCFYCYEAQRLNPVFKDIDLTFIDKIFIANYHKMGYVDLAILLKRSHKSLWKRAVKFGLGKKPYVTNKNT